MSEDYVKKEVFKIWTDTHKELQNQQTTHQNEILTSLSNEIKRIADKGEETNKNVGSLIELIKEDNNLTRKILDQHIIEYDNNNDKNSEKFKNLFKRQDAQDKILIESAPVWKFWSGLSKKAKTLFTAIVLALSVLIAQNIFIDWSNGETQEVKNETTTKDK